MGDYVLSTALLYVSHTHSEAIVRRLAGLGQTLSDGEILQLSNIQRKDITEEAYYRIIERKTAALFEACAAIGAVSAGASEEEVDAARCFGKNLGIVFQIRDDIFDYYDSETNIGKPTGNDLAEGKLTLPVIYALNSAKNDEMLALANKVKAHEVTREEIGRLVAERRMWDFHAEAQTFLDKYVKDESIRTSLQTYLDYVIKREK